MSRQKANILETTFLNWFSGIKSLYGNLRRHRADHNVTVIIFFKIFILFSTTQRRTGLCWPANMIQSNPAKTCSILRVGANLTWTDGDFWTNTDKLLWNYNRIPNNYVLCNQWFLSRMNHFCTSVTLLIQPQCGKWNKWHFRWATF